MRRSITVITAGRVIGADHIFGENPVTQTASAGDLTGPVAWQARRSDHQCPTEKRPQLMAPPFIARWWAIHIYAARRTSPAITSKRWTGKSATSRILLLMTRRGRFAIWSLIRKNWWAGKRVLISPQWIERVSWGEMKVFVKPVARDHQGITRIHGEVARSPGIMRLNCINIMIARDIGRMNSWPVSRLERNTKRLMKGYENTFDSEIVQQLVHRGGCGRHFEPATTELPGQLLPGRGAGNGLMRRLGKAMR